MSELTIDDIKKVIEEGGQEVRDHVETRFKEREESANGKIKPWRKRRRKRKDGSDTRPDTTTD